MNAEINNVILNPSISRTIANLQNGDAYVLCETINRATGLILDLKVGNEISSDNIISIISDLRITSSIIKDLVPLKEGGKK